MGCCNIRMLSLLLGWIQVVTFAILVIWYLVSICVFDHEQRTKEAAAMTTTPPTLLHEFETKLMSGTEPSILSVEHNIKADAEVEKKLQSDIMSAPSHEQGETASQPEESAKPSVEGEQPLDKGGAHEAGEQHEGTNAAESSKELSPHEHDKPSTETEYENGSGQESEVATTVSPLKYLDESDSLGGLIVMLIVSVLFLASSIMLVLGILQERPKLMLPYIYWVCVAIVLYIIIIIIYLIVELVEGAGFGDVMLALLNEFIEMALLILFVVPINMQYKRMRLYFDQTERHTLRNSAPVPKPSYVQGDDV